MDNPQETAEVKVSKDWLKLVREIELSWLAGIIDGEGYLGLRLHKDVRGYDYVRPEMHISNTDEKIILKVRDILRRHCQVEGYVRCEKPQKGRKQAYRISTRDMNKMVRILNGVMPQLTGKKLDRAILVDQFCKSRLSGYSPGKRHPYTEREMKLFEMCQPLMKVGSSETLRVADRKRSQIVAEQERRNRQYRKVHEVKCANPACNEVFRAYHGKKYCSTSCYWICMRRGDYASRSEDKVRPLAKA